MPRVRTYLAPVLWLMFGSIGLGFLGICALALWGLVRHYLPTRRDGGHRTAEARRVLGGALGTTAVFTDPAAVLFIVSTLLLLAPVLLLACWSFAIEAASTRLGPGLPLVLIHLFLLWQLVLLGTKVQRKVEISTTELVSSPVIGAKRVLAWTAVSRIEDVTYVGPGVSGLYLYDTIGSHVVLDNWMPDSSVLRALVRGLTPHATWTKRSRGLVVA